MKADKHSKSTKSLKAGKKLEEQTTLSKGAPIVYMRYQMTNVTLHS